MLHYEFQNLVFAQRPDLDHHTSRFSELIDQCGRNERRPRRHHDAIEGGKFRPAKMAVPRIESNICKP